MESRNIEIPIFLDDGNENCCFDGEVDERL
jgi:hypothetical protein